MSKVSATNSSGTSRSSILSSNSSKIYVSHHSQQHSTHPPLRDSKQMFLNRELPPIPTAKKHQPLPPPPPPPVSKGPQIWTIPSFNSFGAYANINSSDANYYSVNNYGTYRQKSFTSDDIYDPNHGAYATSTISTIGLENPAFYSDVDLTNIIRKAVYMSSAEGNKSLNHHHHHHNPLPVLPPFTVNQNQQRLRNEIIASAASLPSIDTTRKRPLSRFWEMRIHDTDRDTQTKNRRTIFCLAILVICLAIVVIGVSAITYWMVSKNFNLGIGWDDSGDGDDNKLANSDSVQLENERDERGSKFILGEFTISNRVFSDALKRSSDGEFEILATEVIKSMDEIFLESPLARVYNSTQISGFSESDSRGVIAKCRITLNIVLLTAAQEVGLTFIHALESGHGRLPAGNLRVDIRTIKFTALSSETPPIILPNPGKSRAHSPPVVKENDETNLKALWSNWSEWSPCRGLNTKCDPGRIHSRLRKCMTENGDVVNSDICRMNNAEQQELEIRDCRCDEESTRQMHSLFDNNNKYNVNMTTKTDEVSHSSFNIERDRACNDCNQNEICLLQVKAAVPFCAKIKDSRDPRGCGGWCSGHKELCRYVGAQTYQCVDDSECLEGEWQCANGLCIPESRRCDGHFNCFDMSDEMHCQCKDDEFHCGNKTSCLPLSQRCDGIIHCWDGEDEQNCTKICSENQFTCNSGQCIPLEFFCDGRYKNCEDGSDEPDGCNAQKCQSNERQCKNGRCVSRTLFCDGINNCEDNSDEIDCTQTFQTNRTETIKKDAPQLTTTATINNDRTSASATIEPLIRAKRLFSNTTNATNAIKISDITSTLSSIINVNNTKD